MCSFKLPLRLHETSCDKIDDEDLFFTPSPTPPLPARNPSHGNAYWDFRLKAPYSAVSLVPPPLFSEVTKLSSFMHEEEEDEDDDDTLDSSSRPTSFGSSVPSSPTPSFQSFTTYASSIHTVAPVFGSVSPRPTRPLYSSPPTEIRSWGYKRVPSHAPPPRLRRRKTPRNKTLRELRTKESERCLQRVYDHQLELYLNGALFPRARRKEGLNCLEEE